MFDDTFRRIDTVRRTETGNQCCYLDHWLRVPVWEFPIGPDSVEDLQHAEALEINAKEYPNIHIHWERSGRDCDGGHGDYGIIRPDERYLNDDGSVNFYEFWRSQFQFLASAYAFDGTLTVSGDPYDQTQQKASWHETTEEGYRAEEIYLCTDECERPRNTVYDQYAQEAGY